jgi:hypothetical protein
LAQSQGPVYNSVVVGQNYLWQMLMSSDSKAIFQAFGYATLILASVFLFLYLMNLRSRFYYNGPDYSFLFWLFA